MNWQDIPYYQINTAMAIVMAMSFTALATLMALLGPRTLLEKLATYKTVCFALIMWRVVLSVFHPSMFGFGNSLIASVVFFFGTLTTLVFGVVAWYEHMDDYFKHRNKDK